MADIVSLDQKSQKVKIKEFEIENSVVFNYFDKLPADLRGEKLLKAIYLGVLASMEDRLSAFLSRTQNELGTELESLKMIFDMKKELFYKTTEKGLIAEDEIAEFMNEYFQSKKSDDKAELTGTSEGLIPKNKTGDIVCYINGNKDKKITLEIKFDKSLNLGDIYTKDVFTKKQDTAWSQLIEANANRGSKNSIIVFDKSLVDNSIKNITESVAFIPAVGFIVLVDSQRGDFSNLVIAYNLARDITLNAKGAEIDVKILELIIKRIINTIVSFQNVRKLVESNIDNSQKILKEIEKGLMLMEFNEKYLLKFLHDGNLSHRDLLAFYSGEEVKEAFKPIEKEIEGMLGT